MRLDPADFRLDGDGTATDGTFQPTVPRRETRSMTPEEIEELQTAVQDAIALGATPEAMKPVNDFINRVAEPKPSPAHVTGGPTFNPPAEEQPVAEQKPEDEDTQPGGTA
jgi:hypothetical protein